MKVEDLDILMTKEESVALTEVTANPKAILNDLRDLAPLVRRPTRQREIEDFIKGRNPAQNKIVAAFLADLGDELSGGLKLP